MSEAGALRAARFGANLLPQGPRAQSLDAWTAKLRAEAATRRAIASASFAPAWFTDDRERDWGAVRIAERRRMEVYKPLSGGSGWARRRRRHHRSRSDSPDLGGRRRRSLRGRACRFHRRVWIDRYRLVGVRQVCGRTR